MHVLLGVIIGVVATLILVVVGFLYVCFRLTFRG